MTNGVLPSFVYVAFDEARRETKIGITSNLAVRLATLRVGRPTLSIVWSTTEVRTDAAGVEYAAQDALRDQHIGEEWFSVSPDEAVLSVQAALAKVDAGERLVWKRISSGERLQRPATLGIRTTPALKLAAKQAASKDRRTVSQWIENLIIAATERKK